MTDKELRKNALKVVAVIAIVVVINTIFRRNVDGSTCLSLIDIYIEAFSYIFISLYYIPICIKDINLADIIIGQALGQSNTNCLPALRAGRQNFLL